MPAGNHAACVRPASVPRSRRALPLAKRANLSRTEPVRRSNILLHRNPPSGRLYGGPARAVSPRHHMTHVIAAIHQRAAPTNIRCRVRRPGGIAAWSVDRSPRCGRRREGRARRSRSAGLATHSTEYLVQSLMETPDLGWAREEHARRSVERNDDGQDDGDCKAQDHIRRGQDH